MGQGVRQGLNHFDEFDHRARPAVEEEERFTVSTGRTCVDEMNLLVVDFSEKLGIAVQSLLLRPPVKGCLPAIDQARNIARRRSIAPIARLNFTRPGCLVQAHLQSIYLRLRHTDLEWSNLRCHAQARLGWSNRPAISD